MAENYLTLKVTLAQVGEKVYRSRIEQSARGASSGPGCDFAVSSDLFQEVETFIGRMHVGGLGSKDVRDLGLALFSLIFGDKVGVKYQECLALAQATTGTRLRIALNVLPLELVSFPWEYLYDGQSFLLKSGHSIIRVIDELAEKKAPFGPVAHLLVAIANPEDPDLELFDADAYEERLKDLFGRIPGLNAKILLRATPGEVEDEINSGAHDAFYFVGHGRFAESFEGQLLFERKDRKPDPVNADYLAQVLRDAESVRFVYLNSCSTAKTGAKNPFAGVAQRLLRDGDVAAAVAMQTDVDQDSALAIAEGFFDGLRRGQSPERAMIRSRLRASNGHSWGVPVVYTYMAGPEEFDRNRIACLLSSKRDQSRFALFLPTFQKGFLVGEARPPEIMDTGIYAYPGSTFASTDVLAAWQVLHLLMKIANPSDIEWLQANEIPKGKLSHWFLFGSRSNKILASIVKGYEPAVRFHYNNPASPGKWGLEDRRYGTLYEVDDPSRLDPGEYELREDFGALEKIVNEKTGTVFFLLSGLGDRATLGCALYLAEKWDVLLEKYGGREFHVILRFRGGLPITEAEEIESDEPTTKVQPAG